jgi:glycosyltransferase involved in cell wall biosynthesis
VILANHSHTAWPVFFANCGMAKKFYYIQAYEPDFYPIRTKFKAHILARLSYVLPLKQIANASIYKGFGMAPLDIIPPGIDISIFRKKGGFFSIANKPEIIIGTIGRSEPYKGTHTAVSAYRKLRASDPRLRLKVAFGNVAHADDIEIVAIKNDEELAEFYRSLDVLLVACSTQHGAPHYPVIEAMASGVPVVHTNYYPGDSGNSWIAKDSSTDAVADALREFLNSSELDIADKTERARLTIEKELGWDAVGRRFLLNFARRN